MERVLQLLAQIAASLTEDLYNKQLEKFRQKYVPSHVREIGYCYGPKGTAGHDPKR